MKKQTIKEKGQQKKKKSKVIEWVTPSPTPVQPVITPPKVMTKEEQVLAIMEEVAKEICPATQWKAWTQKTIIKLKEMGLFSPNYDTLQAEFCKRY